MTAIAGDDAGEKNGSAFGSEEGDGSLGTLTIGDQMMVHAGQDVYDAPDHLFPYDQRVPACFYRPFAEIKACNHQDATYTVSGPEATDTHTLACPTASTVPRSSTPSATPPPAPSAVSAAPSAPSASTCPRRRATTIPTATTAPRRSR